jgi:hypothetical protein
MTKDGNGNQNEIIQIDSVEKFIYYKCIENYVDTLTRKRCRPTLAGSLIQKYNKEGPCYSAQISPDDGFCCIDQKLYMVYTVCVLCGVLSCLPHSAAV